jgi:hypothetical protein
LYGELRTAIVMVDDVDEEGVVCLLFLCFERPKLWTAAGDFGR